MTHRLVYCITEGHGEPVKIGVTQSLRNRFSTIQTHTWRPMHIAWASWGTVSHEAALKAALQPRHFRCEWFNDADDAIKGALPAFGDISTLRYERKDAFLKAMRKARFDWGLVGAWRVWNSYYEEVFTPRFDERFRSQIEAAGQAIGFPLTADDFAPRTYDAIERAISALRLAIPHQETAA